jgi:DNA-binding CsgD family transcriptional regulator
MNKRDPSSRRRSYDATLRKTFRSTLGHLLQTEFPGVFGPAVTRLFSERIDELYESFHPPGSRFGAGQCLWIAVAIDDPPARNKRIEQTRLVPVVLDLVKADDVEDAVAGSVRAKTRPKKVLRLFRQAHAQGGLLTEADVSLLLHLPINTVSAIVLKHEREAGETIPRRGTVHDMGRSVTHKRIICYKRLVEKKTTSQVAQETFHSPEEVEYYVQSLRRVHLCQSAGMSEEDIAAATGRSISLVREYLDLIRDFNLTDVPPDAEEI